MAISSNFKEQSTSVGIYLKELRKIKRNTMTDKFSDDPVYNNFLSAWQSAENDMIADPESKDKQNIEMKRRGVLEDYINSNYSQQELAALPLTTNKGNRNREIENCLPMVYSLASYYVKTSKEMVGFDDLIAYGNLGLVTAADKYFTTEVPSESIARLRTKGFAKFSTYAYFWIKKTMIEGSFELGSIGFSGSSKTKEEVSKEVQIMGQDHKSGSDNREYDIENKSPWEVEMDSVSMKENKELRLAQDDANELRKYVKSVFSSLTKYEKRIIFLALGIDTPNGVFLNYTEIAQMMDVSKNKISMDFARAYNKLRTQASQKLHGEDAVTMASLILGNDMNDVNLPELRMESTSGYNENTAPYGADLIKKHRTEF